MQVLIRWKYYLSGSFNSGNSIIVTVPAVNPVSLNELVVGCARVVVPGTTVNPAVVPLYTL